MNCAPCITRLFSGHLACPVPEKAVSGTEYLFRTGKACFLHRMPLKMRRVPQEPVFCTARIFRTVGGPLRYRILRMPEKRRALPGTWPGMPPRARKSQPPRPTNSKALHNLPITTAVNHPASTPCHHSYTPNHQHPQPPSHHSTPKLHRPPTHKKRSPD